jgi:N utilization substance protein B
VTTADDEVTTPAAPRPGTVHPHLARERALKVLFQADVRGHDARRLLDRIETTHGALELLDELEPDEAQVAADGELRRELTRRRRLPLDEYTRTLVAGVTANRPAIDRVLGDVAQRWSVTRMPVVDRNLLRLAVYELTAQDTPPAVVIDEAVSFARAFAGERSHPFVNGVLETVRRRVAAGELTFDEADEAPLPADGGGAGDTPVASEDAAVAAEGPEDGPPGAADEVDEAAGAAWAAALDLLADGEDDALDDLDDLDGLDVDDLDELDGGDPEGPAPRDRRLVEPPGDDVVQATLDLGDETSASPDDD